MPIDLLFSYATGPTHQTKKSEQQDQLMPSESYAKSNAAHEQSKDLHTYEDFMSSFKCPMPTWESEQRQLTKTISTEQGAGLKPVESSSSRNPMPNQSTHMISESAKLSLLESSTLMCMLHKEDLKRVRTATSDGILLHWA